MIKALFRVTDRLLDRNAVALVVAYALFGAVLFFLIIWVYFMFFG